ncbi:MAG TPA: diaminopimelate epimerase [Longimicrobiales bacterium]|nr:diaminopimelate epimerase [Longimicrobiales bacterium]
MRFWKGHALGNDYLVVDGADGGTPSAAMVRALCDRHRGVGGDGVLVAGAGGDGPGSAPGGAGAAASLRIFNPDGSEAEKSGNGLRIFGAWLHLTGRAGPEPFRVRLSGETVEMAVEGPGAPGFVLIRVDMGRASFRAGDVGFTAAGADDEVMGRPLKPAGGAEEVAVHLVSMGNPHCVLFRDVVERSDLLRLGPLVQAEPAFSAGINVQLARVLGPGRLEAMIWERGAGETLASGSSACAVVAAARRSGRAEGDAFVVAMPGGEVEVELSPGYDVRLRGEAGIVFEGRVRDEVLRGWSR